MAVTGFHWKASDVTPRLLKAVGTVTLYWAMIDDQITKILWPFWFRQYPDQRMSRSFDRRIKALVELVTPLYADEPDEYRIFKWYVQRLKDANGQRDDISHGIPGTIIEGKQEYQGLMVPHPSGETKYKPKKFTQIEALAKTLTALHGETVEVGSAIWAAHAAASPDIKVRRAADGWKPLTKENRSPMLPQRVPPPPTFQA